MSIEEELTRRGIVRPHPFFKRMETGGWRYQGICARGRGYAFGFWRGDVGAVQVAFFPMSLLRNRRAPKKK